MDIKFHVIAIVLYMMELLPTRSTFRLTLMKDLTRKQGKGPCLRGRWIQFGSLRFWQRKPCNGLRRNGKRPPKNKTPPAGAGPDIDLDELPSLEQGPKRRPDYDPNYGYEPYWADGDWVFDKRPDNKSDPRYMCGTRCSVAYIEYGVICARNKDYEYHTFPNYCVMRSLDCSDLGHWRVLYRGKCYRGADLFPDATLQARVRLFISSFIDNSEFTKSWAGFYSDGPGYTDKTEKPAPL